MEGIEEIHQDLIGEIRDNERLGDNEYHEGYKLGFLEAIDIYRDRIRDKLNDFYDRGFEKGFMQGMTIGRSRELLEIKNRVESGEDIEDVLEDLCGDDWKEIVEND